MGWGKIDVDWKQLESMWLVGYLGEIVVGSRAVAGQVLLLGTSAGVKWVVMLLLSVEAKAALRQCATYR